METTDVGSLCVNVDSSIAINVILWWGIFIMGRLGMCRGRRVNGKYLYLFNFGGELKLL